jgi:hypothetical protein
VFKIHPFDPMSAGSFMFQSAPIFIGVIFIIVIGFIIVSTIKGVSQWNKNNHSPRLTVPATVTSRRTHIARRAGNDHHSSHTSYFITFEFESGDRSEFKLAGTEYGQLAEGDQGLLTFQGTRYLGFERESL